MVENAVITHFRIRKTTMRSVAPPKQEVVFDIFEKIDVRVGTILEVKDVPDSRKLVRLKVDLGFAVRTVVTGFINERDNPKEIEGLQALFVVNLPLVKRRAPCPKPCCSTSDTPTRSHTF